ncbi:MAG TPA: sugar phosphate isomerase/epimerase [Verrucomicrobiae bacterium]|jgi:sugar phosphate isomerase/epimerase|nr:sugar phosphate isomerase/epimerase [Verrucomicrobiae bacterium]
MEEFEWIKRLGFHSMQWMRFAESRAGIAHDVWKPFAEEFAAGAQAHGIRISAIGADYRNPLDPRQTEGTRAIYRRAIEVAAHIGVKTVSGFAGAVIETDLNERGGNPVYRPLENHLDQVVAFWEPLAHFAAERGVRLAFENCPQGAWHLPVMHYNIMGQPAMWERFFNATKCENIGLEWDASHLVCQFIDPVENIRRFGRRIFHVHAKDALINRQLLEVYGPCHPGVAEHRFPGLGQSNWGEIVHALLRAGYDSDLNIEGWHDPVYRDKLEEAGLLIAKRTLEQFAAGTESTSP